MQSYDLNLQQLKLYVIVQSIFRRGAEQGFIRDTPCRNVILPKRKKVVKQGFRKTAQRFMITSKVSRGTDFVSSGSAVHRYVRSEVPWTCLRISL